MPPIISLREFDAGPPHGGHLLQQLVGRGKVEARRLSLGEDLSCAARPVVCLCQRPEKHAAHAGTAIGQDRTFGLLPGAAEALDDLGTEGCHGYREVMLAEAQSFEGGDGIGGGRLLWLFTNDVIVVAS